MGRPSINAVKAAPFPGQGGFSIGDRVTLVDRDQVRTQDIGTVEIITDKGIQILWDNNCPDWPGLKQPPPLHRTFQPDELERAREKKSDIFSDIRSAGKQFI